MPTKPNTEKFEVHLARLNNLSAEQLHGLLPLIPQDPAPKWAKDMIRDRINQLLKRKAQ